MRHTFSAKDNNQSFKLDSLFFTLSTTPFEKYFFLRFSPIGMLWHLKGIDI